MEAALTGAVLTETIIKIARIRNIVLPTLINVLRFEFSKLGSQPFLCRARDSEAFLPLASR
jgi:hypothetical protein